MQRGCHVTGCDRRAFQRYDVSLELRYKAMKGRTVYEMGRGVTCDLSSGGVAFISDQTLPAGATIELWIDWPVRLYDQHALRLVVSGKVVRSSQAVTAVRTIRHEFRTAGSQQLRDAAMRAQGLTWKPGRAAGEV